MHTENFGKYEVQPKCVYRIRHVCIHMCTSYSRAERLRCAAAAEENACCGAATRDGCYVRVLDLDLVQAAHHVGGCVGV
jgi:hypothetical protein